MKNTMLFVFFIFFLMGIYPQEIKYKINQGSYFFDEASIYCEDKIPLNKQGTILSETQDVIYVLGDYYSSTVHFSDFHNPIVVRDSSGQTHFAIIEDLVRDTLDSKIHDDLNGSYTLSYYFDILKETSAASYFDKEPYWINEWRTSVGETVFEDMYNTELVISDNYLFISQYDQQERVFLIIDEIYDDGAYFFKVCLGKNILRFMNEAKDTFLNEFQKPDIYNVVIKKDGDYLKFYKDSVDNKPLAEFVGSTMMSNKKIRDSLRCIARGEKIDLNDITFPRHADGSCDYDANGNATAVASGILDTSAEKAVIPKSAPDLEKTAVVTENLRLRTDYDTTAEVVATLAAGTRVKVHLPGKEDTIDGIASNWVWVETLVGAKDKDGNTVAAGTKGWLFGGYLSEAEDAKQNAALPILPIVAGVAALVVLLAVVLLAAKKKKVNIMTDVYKLIADMICNSIDDKWEKAVVEIESSPWQMLSTSAYYFKDGHKNAFGLIDDNQDEDLGENIFELQESMQSKNKWNRAVYTLERNGHFDMEFIWDQALQDEWDKA